MTPERLKTIAEQLRDDLTDMANDTAREPRPALIYPMALDVIATTPFLCRLLAERLSGDPS